MTDINTAVTISDDGTVLAAGYRLDQYEIESVLAIGDFRITYYAWDHRADRNVVIHEYYPRSLCIRDQDKISVTSETRERFTDFEFGLSEFLLEARLVSQIRSPYLPNVIEYREANGTGYLVSEYDDGRTLAEWLKKDNSPLSEKQLGEILNSCLHGLRELHARNLLHTSVSPKSIFIRYHGHPILLGQGLARYRLAQYTKTYTISLSPGYTPLEQYGLDGKIGPWSDLYALGASLYECVAGIRPIDASARHTALIKGEQDPLTPAVEIAHGSYSNLLLSNIDWMLKPYLEDRPDSADLMLGVVSFQKQSKHKKSPLTARPGETGQYLDQYSDNASGQSLSDNMPGDKTGEPEQIDSAPEAIPDSGRKFYWSLGLLLMAFVCLTAYQIYKHEINPAQVQPIDEQAAQTLFKPEEVRPPITQDKNDSSTSSTENRMISRESDEQRREFYEFAYREDEVKRRVEEELEALKRAELAQQEQLEAEKNLEIETLLKKADEAINNDSLVTPEGESAFDYFSMVLNMETDNESAIAGLNEIADKYFDLAIAAIEDADPDTAGRHLRGLIKVRPDDPRLDGFLQQITDLKAKIKLDKVKAELEEKIRQDQQAEAERLAQQFLKQERLEQEQLEQEKRDAQEKQNDSRTDFAVDGDQQVESITEIATGENNSIENKPASNGSADESLKSTAAPPTSSVPGQITPAIDRVNLAANYRRYDRGEYSAELFKSIQDAANANDGRSQYIIAEMYAAGRGTEQNFAESTYWLKKSLDYVNKNAQYRQAWAEKAMGVIYEKGWYVDSNPERAVRWYKSAADKNYAPAQYRLGLAYAKGLGVPKDINEATFWLKKALSNGNQEAKKALSKLPVKY